jgi:hypothetical protein
VLPAFVLHDVLVLGGSIGRALVLTMALVAVLGVALLHVLFGVANFQPGFPKLEGIAAIIAGVALLASAVMARRSMYRALLTACVGTLPLVAWFAYAVPLEGSSDPAYFWVSLIIPITTGSAAWALRRRRGDYRTSRTDTPGDRTCASR